jgi:hypothetical protein
MSKTAIKWYVYWDNGANASGTLPGGFDTEAEAQAYADQWARERNLEDLGFTDADVEERGGEGCYAAEVRWQEIGPEPDEEELIRREPWE